MRVFIEVRTKFEKGKTAESEIRRVYKLLVAQQFWERVDKSEFEELLNAMASRLPPEDLFGFAKNAKLGLRLLSPQAQLTIGAFVEDEWVRVRLRIMAENDAVIVQLGEDVANALLAGLSDFDLVGLNLWRDGKHQDLLAGGVVVHPKITFRDAFKKNPQWRWPLLFSVVLLLAGGIASEWYYRHRLGSTVPYWLNDPIWVWYTRLVAPLLMAIVTSLASLYSLVRKRGSREARWKLKSGRPAPAGAFPE